MNERLKQEHTPSSLEVIESVQETEHKQNLERVFKLNPELATVGSVEQYAEYLKKIFPQSLVNGEIFGHGNTESFKDTGFVKGKGRTRIAYSEDGTHYGFYFGDFYSHYGSTTDNPNRLSYGVVLDAKNPRYIRPGVDKGLSSIDTRRSIKEQYGITEEDSIVQIGPHWDSHSNLYTKEEAREHGNEIEKEFDKYLKTQGKNIENFDEEKDFDYALKFIDQHGVTSLGITEFVVFEPAQIHILGSQEDIREFKEFITNANN